jgi:hypothetical protein
MYPVLVNQEYSLILPLSGTAMTRQLPDIRKFPVATSDPPAGGRYLRNLK